MVITKLNGGLGNQMFQYAAARRIAYTNHDRLKLDITAFGEHQFRKYCLNQLNIVEEIATEYEIEDMKNTRLVQEEYFHFNPAVLNLKSDIYLDGYWQSEQYFKDISETIRLEFSVRSALSGANLEMADAIRNLAAIAVHFRRGDYVTVPENQQYNGTCELGYYQEAMTAMAERVPEVHFFIFSDDLPWVRENIRFDFPCTFVGLNNCENGFEDLRLMSFCRHHIIANSTFSWWGAWLSQNPEKIVFAPRKWFNIPGIYTGDLIPKGWNLL